MKLIKKLLLGIGIIVAIGAGFSYYYFSIPRGPIYEFNAQRDTKAIVDLFERERYWVTAVPDSSPEFILKYRMPHKSPLYAGKLQIKVLRENNVFVGFITYYMDVLEKNIGHIFIMAVESAFRGKSYGKKLLQFALNDLKSMGAKVVKLVTRTTNIPAQKLYTSAGFVETLRTEDGFVYYEYRF
jgi:ribosomal protein S18 acetylase RimI-like enzyme